MSRVLIGLRTALIKRCRPCRIQFSTADWFADNVSWVAAKLHRVLVAAGFTKAYLERLGQWQSSMWWCGIKGDWDEVETARDLHNSLDAGPVDGVHNLDTIIIHHHHHYNHAFMHTPKSVDIHMVGPRHALTLRLKSQRLYLILILTRPAWVCMSTRLHISIVIIIIIIWKRQIAAPTRHSEISHFALWCYVRFSHCIHSSSLSIITDCSFLYASPCLRNQPHTSFSITDSAIPAPISSSSVDSPLCTSITPSLFHSQPKTYLFHKSFPP